MVNMYLLNYTINKEAIAVAMLADTALMHTRPCLSL